MSTNSVTGSKWVFDKKTEDWTSNYRGENIKYPIMDLDERLRIIEERLLIIDPPIDMLSKYPALAEAYREYKIIEKLTLGNDT